MSLTHDDLQILRGYFQVNEHLFDYDGFVYIDELAISERIEQIDPGFGLKLRDQPHEVVITGIGINIQLSVICDITIKGVTRSGVGSADVIFKQYEDKQTGDITREAIVNQAYKSAATDALKRASRLFGIGRYLLHAPTPDSKYPKADERIRLTTKWLQSLTGNGQTVQSTPNNQRRIPQPQPDDNGRRDVLLVEAIKDVTKPSNPKYRFKVDGQKSNDYTVSCFCSQFAQWSGLSSLKDASAYDEATGVYTPIHPIKAQIEQNGNFWNVVSVERLVKS